MISLLVWDENVCADDAFSDDDFITVSDPPQPVFIPPGWISCSPPADATILNETFEQPGASFEWSFPGGSPPATSGYDPPVVTYNAVGSYDITLTTADGLCPKDSTFIDAVIVGSPIADFTADRTNICPGESIQFTNLELISP